MCIDVHCHIDQLTFEEQERELKKYRVIGTAVHYESGENLLRLQKRYPNNVKVCLGIHPEYPDSFHEYDLVEKQIRENREIIAGIGEIGLPHFNLFGMNASEREHALKEASELFEKFLHLSSVLNLPVNLHCVKDSLPLGIELLKRYGIKNALFHWFEGGEKDIKQIKEAGWNISISPDIITNAEYRSFIKKISPDIREIFTLESDGPCVYDGKRGMPSMIEKTASVLAEIFNADTEEIITISERNAEMLFFASYGESVLL